MSISMERVIFRFKRPSGSVQNQPSEALHEALMLLSECDEVQPLLDEADEGGKIVAIEVFQSGNGHLILIHFTQEAA